MIPMKVIIQYLESGWYDTVFVNQVCHKGDIIRISDELARVIAGSVLPR